MRINKLFIAVLTVLIAALMLGISLVQANGNDGRVVVRVFMDTNNNARDDAKDFGLAGWEVRLGNQVIGTTGPDGFATIPAAAVGQRVSITPPSEGWRLSRQGGGLEAPGVSGVYRVNNNNVIYIVGGAYILQSGDFKSRVNGNDEAWLRFSVIRVNRITVGGANPGDTIEFSGPNWVGNGQPTLTKTAGPNGFASVVGGAFFYSRTYTVTNVTQSKSFNVTIPFSWQPNVNFASDTCNNCN